MFWCLRLVVAARCLTILLLTCSLPTPFVWNPSNSFIKTTFIDASLLMPLYASKMLLLNSAFAFCFSEFCFAFLRFEILLCKNAFRILLCISAFEVCRSILLLNYDLQFCYAILRLNYFVILSLMCSVYVTYGSIKVGRDVDFFLSKSNYFKMK